MTQLAGLGVLVAIAIAAALVILSAVIARDAVNPPRHTTGYALARRLASDPGDLGLRYESWTLDLPDGARLPVWEIDGQGEGTAVLVHDWGESRIDSLARREWWTRRCARVVLYDLRGHGEARGGASRLGAGEHLDLLALLERLGTGPFMLVGCGLGASIAIAAAEVSNRDAVKGVSVYRSFPGVGPWLRGWLRSKGLPAGVLAWLALGWLRLATRPRRQPGVSPSASSSGARCAS